MISYYFSDKIFLHSVLLFSCDCIGIAQTGCEQVLVSGSGKDGVPELALRSTPLQSALGGAELIFHQCASRTTLKKWEKCDYFSFSRPLA